MNTRCKDARLRRHGQLRGSSLPPISTGRSHDAKSGRKPNTLHPKLHIILFGVLGNLPVMAQVGDQLRVRPLLSTGK